MVCFYPVKMYKLRVGKNEFTYTHSPHQITKKNLVKEIQRQCGYCIGCRLRHSREWAIRCMHEASLYWNNCWLTLTLNEEYKNTRENPLSLEKGQKSEITRFLKRLRKKYGEGIRYYYCGEYGETCFYCNKNEKFCKCEQYLSWIGRPHYHVCLFNHDFQDKEFYKERDGMIYYTSQSLDQLWTDPKTKLHMGQAIITDLTPDTAAYTARYTMKKIYGRASTQEKIYGLTHYQRLTSDGEIIDLIPEYTNMSRGSKILKTGGIGRGWLEKYNKEVLDNDGVFFKTLNIKSPRYYDKWLEKTFPEIYEENSQNRLDPSYLIDNTRYRLKQREEITLVKASQLQRKEV